LAENKKPCKSEIYRVLEWFDNRFSGISSNTEDMFKWDQVLYTDKLISKQEQEFAYLPAKLTDGSIASLTGIPYGFGWLLMGE